MNQSYSNNPGIIKLTPKLRKLIPENYTNLKIITHKKGSDDHINPITKRQKQIFVVTQEQFNIRQSYFNSPKENELIVDLLEELIKRIEWQALETNYHPLKRTHQFRTLSVRKAIIALKKYQYPITNYVQALEIPGIGDRIAQRIDEIIRTGTLKELNVQPSPFVKAIQNLTKITGIGEELAKKLITTFHVLNVEDLERKIAEGTINHKNLLNDQVVIGVKYYWDLQQKIPYSEVLEIKAYLRNIIYEVCPFLKIKICGSHRRKKPESRDIDVLMVHPGIETSVEIIMSKEQYLRILVEVLYDRGFLIETITFGLTKFLGVAKWKGLARRIDILWVPRDSYFYSLIYFTGSDIFNRIMRTVALKKGYSLNNYGLYPLKEHCRFRRTGDGVDRTVNYKTTLKDEKAPKQYVTGEKIPVKSEMEIFQILGIHYLKPEERG